MVAMKDILKPGKRVRIVRQMPQRDQCWTPSVEGTLVSYRQEPTGAWFAHSKNHKLWLDRAMTRMDDGELTDCVLDNYTRIEPSSGAAPVVQAVTVDSAAGSARPNSRKWRSAAAFVGVLALSALALAAAMMPLRLIAIGALCFFFLALWMSSPVLLALMSTLGHRLAPVVTRLRALRTDNRVEVVTDGGSIRARESAGVPRRRAVPLRARRFSIAHHHYLKHKRTHAMNGHNAVITTRDFERLQDLAQSPQSQFYGPMTVLENGLRRGSVVAPCRVGRNVVTMNSRVRVQDLQSGERDTYTLVYPAHADIDEGKLSVLAPLGAALLGAKVRQVVLVKTPRGDRRLRIERILYQPEAAGDYHL
jgi:regulator of nucleoside diphosphate kinase